MLVETYKGIEFVRIANLPEEQRSLVAQTLDPDKVIKIQRGKELLKDCIQLADYQKWTIEKLRVQQHAQATDGTPVGPTKLAV